MRGPAPHPASCTFDDCRTEGECLHDQACPTVPPPEPPAVLDHKQIDAAYVAVASVCAVYPHLERTLGRVAILLNALSRPDRDGEPSETPSRVRVIPENYWREVWHDGCPNRGPMRRLSGTLTIEDGSVLRLYECLGCPVRTYAGLDTKRRVVTRPAPAAPGGTDG